MDATYLVRIDGFKGGLAAVSVDGRRYHFIKPDGTVAFDGNYYDRQGRLIWTAPPIDLKVRQKVLAEKMTFSGDALERTVGFIMLRRDQEALALLRANPEFLNAPTRTDLWKESVGTMPSSIALC